MRPTTQQNNVRQRKTIAIVAALAVVAIALAAVVSAFNGVWMAYRALNILSHRIWLIYGRFGRLGFTAGSLVQNVHPALAVIS